MSTCCTSWRRVISGEAHGVGPALARGALTVLSKPYGWAASMRDVVTSGEAVFVAAPVISVGNITAGGTGKTPFVSLVIDELQKRGRRPVVLSRGYKAGEDGTNDEAKVLARRHPGVVHLQGCNRLEMAQRAVDTRLGDTIVLDDGFQVRNLGRNLDICLIDATNPWGYGAVLPRGLLREPLSGLYRARPVVITRTEIAAPHTVAAIRKEILHWNEHARIVVSEMRFTKLTDAHGASAGAPSDLAGKRVFCASGIGNPAAFAAGVRTLGARTVGSADLADHHAWTQADVVDVVRQAREVAAEVVVATVKDAVKLAGLAWPAGAPPLRVLEVEAVVTGDAPLWTKLLDEALARK